MLGSLCASRKTYCARARSTTGNRSKKVRILFIPQKLCLYLFSLELKTAAKETSTYSALNNLLFLLYLYMVILDSTSAKSS